MNERNISPKDGSGQKKPSNILLITSDKQNLPAALQAAVSFPAREGYLQVKVATRLSLARKWIQQFEVSCLLVDLASMDFSKDHLGSEYGIYRAFPVIGLLSSDITSEQLLRATNRFQFFAIVDADNEQEIRAYIEEGITSYEESADREGLLEKIRHQNKLLENVTGDLQGVVHQRTARIYESRKKRESQIQSMKQWIRFIKDLSYIRSVEDLTLLIRTEMRRFHSLGPPYLIYRLEGGVWRLLFFDRHQLTEKKVNQWLAGGDQSVDQGQWQRSLANTLGRPVYPLFIHQFGCKLYRKENAEQQAFLFFEIDGHNFKEQDQKEIVQLAQAIDIALERLLLQERLLFATAHWEKTFDGIQDPVAIIDKDHRVLRCNKHFERVSVQGRCYQQLMGRQVACDSCPLKNNVQQGNTAEIRSEQQVFELHTFPISGGGNYRAITHVNHYRDVTLARQLYGRMIQSEKMAAIGMLAGHIAHELNNPLTGLHSLAQVLHSTAQDEPQFRDDLEEVIKAAVRCQKIIKNLLEFSSSREGLENKPVDVNEIIDNTLPLLKSALRDHEQDFHFCKEPVYIQADAQLLQQVVFNLINNACQAMAGEPGLISIESKVSQIENECWFQMAIRDSGGGIKEEHLPYIFDPFFTTKEEGQGTGLGLSISQSIIKGVGGRIEVRNRDRGAEFTLWLPASGESRESLTG